LLKFLVPFIAVVAISTSFTLAVFIGPEALDIRCIGEFQLAAGELGKFGLDSVVMDGLFMPVIIGQFHVVCNGIGKTVALIRIFLRQRLVDDDFQIFPHV